MNYEIPAGYQQVMPYLIVKDAAMFLKFMKDVFSASERSITMRDEKIIMHAELQIGESTIMFADSTEEFSEQTGGFFVYVDDADERYNKAIAAGGTSSMELSDKEYGRSGGITDPFGNTWWITSIKPKTSTEK